MDVGVYRRRGCWEVISCPSGQAEVVPEKTRLLAPVFHENTQLG